MTNNTQMVKFQGDEIEAVREGSDVWIAVRPICDALGVDFSGQRRKLLDDESATVVMMSTVGADGKQREMLSIGLDSLPLWLATIHPSKVASEVKSKLIAYKRECARVLRDHFFPQAVPSSGPTVEELLVRLDAAEARHALQIAEMQRHLRVLAASAEDHARVSDSREMERRVRDKIHTAAAKCGVSFHAMHGALRDGINQRVPSYRDILRKNAADALGLLDDYIDGRRVFVPGRQRRRANQAPLGRVRKPRAPRGQGVILFPPPGPAKA